MGELNLYLTLVENMSKLMVLALCIIGSIRAEECKTGEKKCTGFLKSICQPSSCGDCPILNLNCDDKEYKYRECEGEWVNTENGKCRKNNYCCSDDAFDKQMSKYLNPEDQDEDEESFTGSNGIKVYT